MWNERLISALDQARPGIAKIIQLGIKKLDTGAKPLKSDEWDTEVGNLGLNPALNYDSMTGDLHCVLQDKCEDGEGLSRIRAAKGDGIEAYFNMYSWYLGRSGQELQSRIAFIMQPPIPKTEGEIAGIIDKWREQRTFVQNYDSKWSLPSPFMKAIIRSMMIGTAREYFEQLQDKAITDDDLIEKCFEYGTRKRLDNKKSDPDHMDISELNLNSNYRSGCQQQGCTQSETDRQLSKQLVSATRQL